MFLFSSEGLNVSKKEVFALPPLMMLITTRFLAEVSFLFFAKVSDSKRCGTVGTFEFARKGEVTSETCPGNPEAWNRPEVLEGEKSGKL